MQRGIQRHNRATGSNDPKISGDPARMIIRQDGQPRSASKVFFRDPSTDRFGHAVKLGVSATLDVIVTLQFQGDVVRPALGAFRKTVIEGGHGSWGIYTKSGSGRSICASMPVFPDSDVEQNAHKVGKL